jgi:hypothetical protein
VKYIAEVHHVLHVVQLAVHDEVITQLYTTVKTVRVWRKCGRIANEGGKKARTKEREERIKRRNLSTLEFVLVPGSCGVLPPAHKLFQCGSTCTHLSVEIKLRKNLAVYV